MTYSFSGPRSNFLSALAFISLLIYSLAPGIMKLTGNQAFFLFGYLNLAIFIKVTSNNFVIKRLIPIKILFIIFIFYGLFITVININYGFAEAKPAAIGFATFMMPLIMSLFCGVSSVIALLRLLPWIGLVHGLIAFLIYPFFPFSDMIGNYLNPLLDGVMAFRLASVSGSLSFSSLMAISFAVCVIKIGAQYEKRYILASISFILLVSLILSIQRSMWLAVIIFIIYAVAYGYIRKVFLIFSLIFLSSILFFIVNQYEGILYTFSDLITSRILSIVSNADDSAFGERAQQWVGVFRNIVELPFGAGVGQIGQANREGQFINGLTGIPDGDYFRIISEFGPLGLLLVVLIIMLTTSRAMKTLAKRDVDRVIHAAAAVLCILVFQGIGSNMTELYFVNFIFFAIFSNFDQINRTLYRSR